MATLASKNRCYIEKGLYCKAGGRNMAHMTQIMLKQCYIYSAATIIIFIIKTFVLF